MGRECCSRVVAPIRVAPEREIASTIAPALDLQMTCGPYRAYFRLRFGPYTPRPVGNTIGNTERPPARLPNSKYAYLLGFSSAPGEIRTPDLRFRRPTLYPAELRARERRSLEGDRRRRSVVARCAASGPGGIRTLGAGVARPKGPRASAAALGSSHGPRAEGEGFEPSGPGLPVQRFSRPSHSTALPPLRVLG